MAPKLLRISTVPISLQSLLKGQLRFMSKNGFEVVGVSSAGKALEDVVRNEKVRTVAVDMSRRITPLKDFLSLIKLYFLFKKEKPTIIHSITPKAGLLSMLAGKMARVPIRIHTFTGLIFPTKTGLLQKLLIKTDQCLCWAATTIYPEGKGVMRDLINYKITSKPLKVIANGNVNGIDLTFFDPSTVSESTRLELRESFGIGSDDFVFTFVGRVVKDKGIEELLEAFEQLQRAYSHVHLFIVGNYESDLDPISAHTEALIDKLPTVHAVGYKADVKKYLAIADALVFPSYREGFPNVVMQAGAMGLPAIVTDINGCNEIIEEGVNGTIIPSKDIRALASAMRKFVNDIDYVKRLKENARGMIASRYEQQIVWNAVLAEYTRLLKDKGLS